MEFETSDGFFQGDAASGVIFNFYFAGSLYHYSAVVSVIRPNPPFHTETLLLIEWEYADDLNCKREREDMELAKRYCDQHGKIAYVAEASVYHIHNERWRQTQRRYEREAIALQKIMPDVQVTRLDMIRYIWVSVIFDAQAAFKDGIFFIFSKSCEIKTILSSSCIKPIVHSLSFLTSLLYLTLSPLLYST